MRKKLKYRNIKTNGYDSKKESHRATELRLLERMGVISDLEEQVSFELIPKQVGMRATKYQADFVYMENGEKVVEDVKSAITKKNPVYRIKKKLLFFRHGILIKET